MDPKSYKIVGGDYDLGGSASRALKDQLKKVGASPAVTRRAMRAAYEAEMNVVIHATGGELRFTLTDERLDVEIIDEGPGIADIKKAMKPGFSTASSKARELGFGAGLGLPNIKNSSDTFTIESAPGKGTEIRFSIKLKPEALYGSGRHSIGVKAENCNQCFHCLHACPTQAVRVHTDRPEILDYLCIDCAACVEVCPTGALYIAGANVELKPKPDTTLVLHPSVLVQFGSTVSPQQVLDALGEMGFDDIVVTAEWENEIRQAAINETNKKEGVRPLIVPICAAVANLIQVRYPSLIPHLLPLLSPFEAVQASLAGRKLLCVTPCACQRTAMSIDAADPKPEFVLPATFRAAVEAHIAKDSPAMDAADCECEQDDWSACDILEVSGIAHVVALLEQVEDGLANDVTLIEPYACNAGGFGSPLLAEEGSLARHRWNSSSFPKDERAKSIERKKPYTARPGLRLDANMAKAVQKLSRIDKTKKQLPGSDCGQCGAPTCAAFAEDVALGRAKLEACTRLNTPPKEKP